MQTKQKILLIIVVAISASLMLQPINAHNDGTNWTIISYAYITATPNPVGVGQTVTVVFWIDVPLPSASYTNNIRRTNYELIITSPDGTNQTQNWPTIADSTSIQFIKFTPSQIGEYTFTFNYPEQKYTWTGPYQNDTFTAATATTKLTVQQEQIPEAIDSYPMPTEYWTRPIEGQNTYWYTISSNWLGAPYISSAGNSFGVPGGNQPWGSAPNTSHIMWTKPVSFGGVVGGNDTSIPGQMFYQGESYNPRFRNPLIIQGVLCYAEPYGNSGNGGDYVGVDLQTGAELWRINTTASGTSLVPSFGLLYSYDTQNQHGVIPNGMLVATANVPGQGTVWRGYDPRNGALTNMNLTNVPAGTAVAGPSGEYLKYILTNYGTTASPMWYLAQWNSSNILTGNWYTTRANASAPSAFDWNVSVNLPPGTWSIGSGSSGAIPLVSKDNLLLLIQGSFGGHVGDFGATITTDPGNITAVSLKSADRGRVLWTRTYPQAPGNVTRYLTNWDPENGVFVFLDKETFVHYGFSLTDGSKLWGPTTVANEPTTAWNYLELYGDNVAYGNLYYSGGYSGIFYAYDIKTGALKWTYGNGGAGNSTSSGFYTPYGAYPTFISAIADGKLYLTIGEHQPKNPVYKNGHLYAINATDGKEIWTIMDWGNAMYGGDSPIADGYLAALNTYSLQLMSIGRGPSALTLATPKAAIELGKSLVISGTVTDIAAGTKQKEQAARFPNGVAAVSDSSVSAWMEYVYMQKPRPTDTTGVPITISVVDANGNYRQIGSTTSDTDGFFAFNWKPDIEGMYTVYASFAGSQAYWPSHAVAAFSVDPAPQPSPTAIPLTASPPFEMYFAASTIAIIIAIVLVGVLILRKRP